MGKQRSRAMRHLELRRRVWWMVMRYPADVAQAFDGPKHRVNLQTSDARVAQQRRDDEERNLRAYFHDIRRGTSGALSKGDWAERRGAHWRETLAELSRDPEAHYAEEGESSAYNLAQDAAQEEEERLAARRSTEGQAKAFLRGLRNQSKVDHHVEQFLSEAELAPKTTNEKRGLLRQFAAWAASHGLGLADIDRKTAGRYVQEKIAPRDRRTGKKHLAAVNTYWNYLKRRGHVTFDVSPWHDQLEPQRARKGSKQEPERAFTTEEVRRLLYGEATGTSKFDDSTREIAICGLLSGMREDEVVSLRMGDVIEGPDGLGTAFDLSRSKTQAGVRMVPVHPDLMDIVARRSEGKNPTEPLFHEFSKTPRPADTLGKRFRRYREARGVNDRREGRRRSLTNFHSTRRWFITEAERAGIAEVTVAAVVGHEEARAKGFTFGTYSG
ncbi:MAG: DUF6538 domain-containing protein, partial [Mesorhizobium sp.]